LGTLGDFRLVREIGRGGMGIVYEAEQISLRRRVALKVLPFAAALDARQIQRFQVEAQAAACLHHRHIVPVHGVGCDRGVHYYAMQLIEGQSLAAMIAELRRLDGLDPPDGPAPGLGRIATSELAARLLSGGLLDRPTGAGSEMSTEAGPDATTAPLPAGASDPEAPTPRASRTGTDRPATAGSSTRNRDYVRGVARLALQAAEALDHAHARGIVHRDIKPGNLLLDARGRLWVTDFGLAQVRGDDRLTLSGDLLGTLRYMSPEQALGRRVAIDGRTDVYSLGVTLYELLTLQPAVNGRDPAEVLRRIAEREPAPLRRLNPAVPRDLETIIAKAMDKDPAARYATAGDLVLDLRRFLEGRPIEARRFSGTERAWRWCRRNPVAAGFLAASSVAALAIVGVVVAFHYNTQLKQQKEVTERLLDVFRHLAYAAGLNLAERDWRDGNVAGTLRHLNETHPPEGKSDLRGFEWYYLDRLTRLEGVLLKGHTGPVRSVAYSRDGTLIASASDDKTVKLWDAATGRLIRTMPATNGVIAVAFHPDGTRLASAGLDRVVTVRDVATGQVIRSLQGHTRDIFELAFSPDGTTLASSSLDGTVRLWNDGDGSAIRTIPDRRAGSRAKLAFSPDSRVLATAGGGEATVRTWAVATGGPLRSISDDLPQPVDGLGGQRRAYSDYPKPVAFSPDGKLMATGGEDGTIRFRDAENGRLVLTLRNPHNLDAVKGLAFSPRGQRLASISDIGRSVSVWDVATGYLMRTIKINTPEIYDVAFAPDDAHLVSGCADGIVRIADATREQEARWLAEGHEANGIAVGSDGSFLATSLADGKVVIHGLANGQIEHTLRAPPGSVGKVVISPDGRRAATAGEDHMVRVWDIATGNSLHVLRGHDGIVYSVAFSRDGKILASASRDKSVRLWDVDAGRQNHILKGHAFPVFAVAFSPDGETVISGDADGFVMLWDAASGRRLRATRSHPGGILVLAISPDGRRLATGGADETIRIHDLAAAREVRALAGHAGDIRGLAFSPDGRRLASSGADGTVRIWDPESGLGVLVLRGHSGPVLSVAFSPDGTQLASASADQTVRIWEANTGPTLPENR
jgi:WD40 repeat protein